MISWSWVGLYYLWVDALRLRYPVPFIGPIETIFGIAGMLAVGWFRFPALWRQEPAFRRRLRWLLAAQGLSLIHI